MIIMRASLRYSCRSDNLLLSNKSLYHAKQREVDRIPWSRLASIDQADHYCLGPPLGGMPPSSELVPSDDERTNDARFTKSISEEQRNGEEGGRSASFESRN